MLLVKSTDEFYLVYFITVNTYECAVFNLFSPCRKTPNGYCCCSDDQSEIMRRKIQKLLDDKLKKSSEISQLKSLLETERESAREDCIECWRRLDLAEAEIRHLRDKVNSKQRKLEQIEEELIRSNNDVRCLASLLTKVNTPCHQLMVYSTGKLCILCCTNNSSDITTKLQVLKTINGHLAIVNCYAICW